VSKEPVTAYISIGSNLGDRAGNLLLGVRGLLEASFAVSKLSGVYETDPVNMPGAPQFLNMAVEVKVDQISPTQMMARMLRIEYLLGRKEKTQKVPRTLDLDLLFYGSTRLETPFLTLPHPRLHLRNFVLVPLSEIASDFVHPTLGPGHIDDPISIDRYFPCDQVAALGFERHRTRPDTARLGHTKGLFLERFMAYLQPDKPEKVYLPAIKAAKERGEKLVCLTAYDYPTARIVDEAGVDMILVGDSIGNVIHGYGNTIPVSMDEIVSACIAVKRGTERAMVIADMPYGSYHVNEDTSVQNALR
jgi:2-amino-4-hydroxy-6-hydroxymethyldihydropteridine diphosphokinase